MMKENFRIQSIHLLAVEGQDECSFFDSYLRYLDINDIQTVDIGGKDKFKIELPLLMRLEGFKDVRTLGLVRDAETNTAQAAFDSILACLKKNRLPEPIAPRVVNRDTNLATGIFIMPDNSGTGMLENLCLSTIIDQPIYACIEQYIHCFSQFQTGVERQSFNEPKARVLSYLASRTPIANSLGIGACKGYWEFGHDCLNDLRAFLIDLYLTI